MKNIYLLAVKNDSNAPIGYDERCISNKSRSNNLIVSKKWGAGHGKVSTKYAESPDNHPVITR